MWWLLSWIVLGLVAGLLARAIVPGRQSMGCIATTLLGIAGSFAGGFLSALLSGHSWRVLRPSGVLGSILGAIVLLVLAQLLSGRRR